MRAFPKLLVVSLLTTLVACSVTAVVYKELPDELSVTVVGLQGTGLVLTNNGGDDLPITGDGVFSFASVARGAAYSVAVKTQPSNPTQLCSISHGSGTLGGSVTDVQVTCSRTAFSVGGTVTGLLGAGAALQNSAGDDLPVNADGTFTFATPVASGASYDVTVRTQPSHPTQVCTVANGTGTVGDSNVTNVAISCVTSAFTIGGTVTGLAGTGLVLRNSGGEELSIRGDGGFTFLAAVPSDSSYEVTVVASPAQPSQRCTVANGTGAVADSSITNVEVTCATSSFTVGGTVTGLAGAGLVIQDNRGDDLAISGDGDFTFETPVASGASFQVTVLHQPSQLTQTCTVLGDAGTVGDGPVTSVAINCATNRYMVGGTITGLVGTVTLQNNGGDDRAVTATGAFAFGTALLSGSAYHVTVKAQPASPPQTCTVTNASGTVGGANITNVTVACVTDSFPISGTITGLIAGDSITLRNNGGDDLVRSTNGNFTFATPVTSGQSYTVTVTDASPFLQTCTIANGTGTVRNGVVNDVAITCVVPPSSGSFSYSATNTSSATQNTTNVDIPMSAGQTLTIGTCGVPGGSGVGDTWLRVFDPGGALEAFDDDACDSLLTFLTFTALTTEVFSVHAGCFLEQSCSGTVAYILSGP